MAMMLTSARMRRGPRTGTATLPLLSVDTTLPAVTGSVISVGAGGDFQAALNSANLGDAIQLAAGATYSGNYTLPNKLLGSGWITIRPSNFASLPAQGSRMTPTIAASLSLPIISSPNTAPAIQPNTSAHHYRFIGCEVTTNTTGNFGLIALQAVTGQTTLAEVPHHLVFDRMYVHGQTSLTLRRGFALNSATTAIIDSDVRDCHDPGQDSQAISCWNGAGPFAILNNYLEGAGENVIFGGSDPSVPNMTPSDVTIRGNHIFKPVAWKGVWDVKNLLEVKHAQRVLIEGNILDGCWLANQVGFACVFKSVNQDGTAPWSVAQDITCRYNWIRNAGGGFNLAASPDNAFDDITARRFTIHDNLLTNINQAPYDGSGQVFQLLDGLIDMMIYHNTMISPTYAALNFGVGAHGPTVRTIFRDNLSGGGSWGVIGDSVGTGSNAINTYMGDGTFTKNVITMASSSGFPAGSFYPASVAALNLNADFSLPIGSPYKNAATDGTDIGCDIPGLLTQVANVIVP